MRQPPAGGAVTPPLPSPVLRGHLPHGLQAWGPGACEGHREARRAPRTKLGALGGAFRDAVSLSSTFLFPHPPASLAALTGLLGFSLPRRQVNSDSICHTLSRQPTQAHSSETQRDVCPRWAHRRGRGRGGGNSLTRQSRQGPGRLTVVILQSSGHFKALSLTGPTSDQSTSKGDGSCARHPRNRQRPGLPPSRRGQVRIWPPALWTGRREAAAALVCTRG